MLDQANIQQCPSRILTSGLPTPNAGETSKIFVFDA